MSNDNLASAVSKMDKKMGATKGCRFNAHARLSRQSSLSTISIALISFYVAALSVITLIPNFMEVLNVTVVSVITCFASLLIIIVSVFESSADYGRQAIEMYRCASEINFLQSKMKILYQGGCLTTEELLKISDDYHQVISRYPINHAAADFAQFKLDTRGDSSGGSYGIFDLIFLNITAFRPYILYYIAMIIPFLATAIIIWLKS